MTRMIFDSHLDIAWNALSYDRDQTLSVEQLRGREAPMADLGRGGSTVSLPQMRKGRVGLCLATVLARAGRGAAAPATRRTDLDYTCQDIAFAVAQGQLAYYRLIEERGLMIAIRDRQTLERVWQTWQSGPAEQAPIGYILSMEGADPIVTPKQLDLWWEQGLRTASLAHYGQGAYAMGTGGDGELTPAGRELVKRFDERGMCLDLAHLADTAFEQAIDLFSGPIFASHGSCRALWNHDRAFSDRQIHVIAERGGAVGAVLDNWQLYEGFKKGQTDRNLITLETVADHVHHVCQLTGSARHAAIGSDLDGGFGIAQSPADLDTIADLHKLEPILSRRGYSDVDIDDIMYGNWLRFFRASLPA